MATLNLFFMEQEEEPRRPQEAMVNDCLDLGMNSSLCTDGADMEKFAESKKKKKIAADKSKETESEEDNLSALISLQGASGGFNWGPSLARALKKESASDVFNMAPAGLVDGAQKGQAWLTALAVAIFEVKMAGQKDLWELVADKAKKFVVKTLGERAEEAMSAAKEVVNKI